MLLRMIMHSAIFTIVVAVGALAANGTGLLNGNSGYGYGDGAPYWDAAYRQAKSHDGDKHKWKRREHDDD